MEDREAYREKKYQQKREKKKKTVQIKRYYNNSAKKDEKFKLNAKYSTKKKSMQLNEVFK